MKYVVSVPTKGSWGYNYPALFCFKAADDTSAQDYFDQERIRALYLHHESRLVSGGINWTLRAQLFRSGSTTRIDTALPKSEKDRREWLKSRYTELRDRWNQMIEQ